MKRNPTNKALALGVGFALSASSIALAGDLTAQQPASSDKSDYSLFNPTPDSLLRELSPDRPDATESPITVDAGRFAIEMSLFDWRRNGDDEASTVLSTNLKLGLDHQTDLQVVFDAFSWEDPASGTGLEGFGDVDVLTISGGTDLKIDRFYIGAEFTTVFGAEVDDFQFNKYNLEEYYQLNTHLHYELDGFL